MKSECGYDNGRAFREARMQERIRKGVLAGNKRPRISMYLEELFVRECTEEIKENRMDFLHQMYSWLSHRK